MSASRMAVAGPISVFPHLVGDVFVMDETTKVAHLAVLVHELNGLEEGERARGLAKRIFEIIDGAGEQERRRLNEIISSKLSQIDQSRHALGRVYDRVHRFSMDNPLVAGLFKDGPTVVTVFRPDFAEKEPQFNWRLVEQAPTVLKNTLKDLQRHRGEFEGPTAEALAPAPNVFQRVSDLLVSLWDWAVSLF